jgi:hypothetical protein
MNKGRRSVTPSEHREHHVLALWVMFGVSSVFTFWQLLITYQAWSFNTYLRSHKNDIGDALVTMVLSHSQRGVCTILLAAEFTDPSTGKQVSVVGPGPHGVIGKRFEWMACEAINRPSAYQKTISVGDHVPIFYAVTDPSKNRPAWVDYQQQMSRVWLIPWISALMSLSLLTTAIAYQRRFNYWRLLNRPRW